MKLPDCNFRRPIDGESTTFRCAHPKVMVEYDLVRAEMCRICPKYGSTMAPKPLGAIIRPIPQRRVSAVARQRAPYTVAVVIPCRNYAGFLPDAIESALAQSRRADEVLVVDDASTDNTAEVARSFAGRGVAYLRVNERHPHRARRAGWLATKSEALVFLDADDALPPDYLESGLQQFRDGRVGIVYSDVQMFGDSQERGSCPDRFDLDGGNEGCGEDWLLWRRIVRDGWLAQKQRAVYLYRRHAASRSRCRRAPRPAAGYFERAALDMETVTLFVPLAGRTVYWPAMASFLDRQAWPHDQLRLVFFDTSQDACFSREVRAWVAACDYRDVRHCREAVGEAGLADRPRAASAKDVSLAMARIYNRLAREAATNYVWIVEDDVLPPLDACRRLLRGFDQETASVSGAYRSRVARGYVAWQPNQRRYAARGEGVERVGGNGFGCVIIRGEVLRQTIFTASIDFAAYDNAFYYRLPLTGLRAKIDWSVECEHRGAAASEIASNFDRGTAFAVNHHQAEIGP